MAKDASFSHIDSAGQARMVNVSEKQASARIARAAAFVAMEKDVLGLVAADRIDKGDVFSVARVAGIMAAKKTADLIPLCHPLRLSDVQVEVLLQDSGIEITSEVKATDKTGVEMEALTAVCIAALTVYDMCKSADKSIEIQNIRLVYKSGGKSGVWERND